MNPTMGALHYILIEPTGRRPGRYCMFLHGLLGRSANWRSFARRFVDAADGWSAVAVDLRMHGDSIGFSAPHTIRACAQDLAALLPRIPGPVAAVLGHSLGGKVALAFAKQHPPDLAHLLVLDSNPGPKPPAAEGELTEKVLAAVAGAHFPIATHQAFWSQMQAKGISLPVAQWLGMNLEKRESGYSFGPDLDAMRALLEDYQRADLWGVVDPTPGWLGVGFLVGGRSEVCAGATRARLERLARASSRFRFAVLERAGHWVHIDDPEGTFRFVAEQLSTPRSE